jgi:DNA-binding FadR family transcriptional regulator
MANTSFGSRLEPLRNGTVSESIVRIITDALVAGELKPGDQLPTEKEFAEKFEVGRNSVREAIKVLRANGIVEIRRGSGMFITESTSPSMLEPLILNLAIQQRPSHELIELRIALETAAAELIIEKASDTAIMRLVEANDALLNEAEKVDHDSHALRDLDIRFHETLYSVSGNELLAKIGQAVYALFRASIEQTVEADPKLAYKNHRLVIEAIRSRDTESLRRRMKGSLAFWTAHVSEHHSQAK